MFARVICAISTWSYARDANFANVLTKGIMPAAAMPTAVETMFCSAILHSTKRSGYRLAKSSENVEFRTSPSSATIRSSAPPSANSAAPYALRVASLPFASAASMPASAIALPKGTGETSRTSSDGTAGGEEGANAPPFSWGTFSVSYNPSNSASAASSLSARTGLPWFDLSLREGHPQPFSVRAMMARHFVRSSGFANAALSASGSWPSIITGCQPNAAALAESTSADCCRET